MKDLFLFIPSMGELVTIAEGTGDNLLQEDIDEGYVDYLMTEVLDLNDNMDQVDGGQILLKRFVRDMTEEEVIKAALGEHYAEDTEYIVLRKE